MKPIPQPGLMELRLRSLNQLFNSMDPSPFHEKDLDSEAENFITGWALEYPREEPLVLAVHLEQKPAEGDAQQIVEEAVHHFFAYRAGVKKREFRDLMRRGRTSLMIGLAFLTMCVLGSQFVGTRGNSAFIRLAQESLLIGGWVAMWRPLEIFLYDWWPLLRMRRLYAKMSRMQVQVRAGE